MAVAHSPRAHARPAANCLEASAFFAVGPNRVRLLRDGREAYPAMLAAIAAAREEILLEMYWIGADAAGRRFRDALCERARAGVRVRVIYDAVGSIGLPSAWWAPLRAAGAHVLEYGPIAPWRRRFRAERLAFRDHRKILIVDSETAFVGGINIAREWLPREEGGDDWRDDAIEMRGVGAAELRVHVCESWARCGGPALATAARTVLRGQRRTWVVANRIDGKPNRRIRRVYNAAIRRAKKSIDISAAYFLPGPLFLHALRAARRRGVRVRVLVPARGDLRVVEHAMMGVLAQLLRDGIEVFAYEPRVLHCKTAVIDARIVILGSHNLDTLSWRYNLESNLVVDDSAFAGEVRRSFERDLEESVELELEAWTRKPPITRALAWLAARFRAFL